MGFSTYYPEGGIDEILGTYDSIEDAREACIVEAKKKENRYRCNYQIIDIQTLKVCLWGDSEINWKEERRKVYWFDNEESLYSSRYKQEPIGNV